MIEPKMYSQPDTKQFGRFSITKTYDSWENAHVESWTSKIDSDRVQEFTKLTNSIIKMFDSYESMQKYFQKYGQLINEDNETLGFFVERPLLVYTVCMTGTDLTITGYFNTKEEE